MAVTIDATGFVQDSGGSTVTLFNFNNITVGAGAKALICILQTASLSAASSTNTATWDSGGTNQSMTSIIYKNSASGSSHDAVMIFGLLNPTPGNKTLQCSWSNACTCCVAAMSFLGVDTSSFANAFKNANSAAVNSTSAALSITSPSGDYAVAAISWTNVATMVPSQWFNDANGVAVCAAHYSAGSGTVNFSATNGGASALYAYVGCDIAAPPSVIPTDVVGVGSTEW